MLASIPTWPLEGVSSRLMSGSPDEDASLPLCHRAPTRLPALTPGPKPYSFDPTPSRRPARAALQMRSSMRTSRTCLLLALAILMSHAGFTRAQCPGGGTPDPICVPTAVCNRYGNDPAPYDPADVAVVQSCFGGALLGHLPYRQGTLRFAYLYQSTSISLDQ